MCVFRSQAFRKRVEPRPRGEPVERASRRSAGARWSRRTRPDRTRRRARPDRRSRRCGGGGGVHRGGDAALVFRGMFVETHSRGFIEGAWNDSFASLNFTAATIVAGTGGILEHDRVRFSTSTDRLGPLFSIVKDGSVYVS